MLMEEGYVSPSLNKDQVRGIEHMEDARIFRMESLFGFVECL